MTDKTTIIADIEHSRDLMKDHRPTAEQVLTGHPHADDISRALNGWSTATRLVGGDGDPLNALHCLVVSIYAMGYKRGKRESSLPVFIVRDPEDMREGL